KEARDQEAARDHAMLTSLKRLEQSSSQIAHSQSALVDALEKVAYLGGPTGGGGADPEVGQALRSMDKQLRALADDLAVGRHETTQALRSELRALIALIDARTRGGGGPGGA
ncbi:MAG: hypothetical protein AAFR79_10720, partial [Pseudomonadota bacterium]